MTEEEKFKGIVERVKGEDWCADRNYVSMMVIVSYLDQLQNEGLIECAFKMAPEGKRIADICEEFEWKPTDLDVRQFLDEMVEETERPAFGYMIKKFRDDREGLFEEITKFRESERGF